MTHTPRLAVACLADDGWHAHGSAHYPATPEGRESARTLVRHTRSGIARGILCGCCRAAVRDVSVVPLTQAGRIDFAAAAHLARLCAREAR